MSVKNATGGGRSETILIMKKNKWNTMNGIFVKGQVTTMLEEGTPNYLQVGLKFIGKLRNEYQGKIVIINERMLEDDEQTLMFLHYNGFEEIKNS